MAKYTLDTDFHSLKPAQAVRWMCEFCQMTEEAFSDQDNRSRLLGHLLLLEAYTNTVCQGLKEHDRELFPLIPEGLELLSHSLEETDDPAEFAEFASNLYACVLEHNTGEELPENSQDFYQEHFEDADLSSNEWLILEWIGGLLLELVVLFGGELDFDFFEEFEGVETIDLFYNMESMMNGFADSYAAIRKLDPYDQVYQTEEFQNTLAFICTGLNAAIQAKPEQFAALQEAYHQKLMVPEEFVSSIIAF